MIQYIKTAKKDFCGICRYCLYEDDAGGFVCHNEKSVMYGEYISDIGQEGCDNFEGGKYEEMSLKDACRIIVQQIEYISHFYKLPGRDIRKPFYALTFKDNEQALDWKDALTRITNRHIFSEYVHLAKEDGDFAEDET